ncbi:MAG: ammonia-forming cytochrome c nitrite reductase subunit c552 [Amphritea sp.]
MGIIIFSVGWISRWGVICVLFAGGNAVWMAQVAIASEQDSESFLRQHWQWPLAPQGSAPESYSELEASLAPEACGACHEEQLADWSTSLHGQAMGPGLMGQLLDMAPHAKGEHQACLRCHAPLAEQADSLVAELQQPTNPSARAAKQLSQKESEQPALHRQGLVCAACHVRNHHRFGPPRKDGSTPAPADRLPHNGWQVTDAFQDSRFCAACHQFEAGEFSLNGKLLENTYEEWRQSRYASEGVSCQQCHMPERRHQWRGIHDPEMVRSGVTIDTSGVELTGNEITAQMRMTNTGTGHRFPTYVTPQVVMHGFQETANGVRLEGTDSYFVVARRVALNLSAEIFDTRLGPDETAVLDYRIVRHPQARTLVFRVWVEPDTFYQMFYASRLQSGQTNRGSALLQQALRAAEASRFTLFEKRMPLL